MNAQDEFGETPLILAAEQSIAAGGLAGVFLARGVLAYFDGWNAIRMAKQNKYDDIAAILERAP